MVERAALGALICAFCWKAARRAGRSTVQPKKTGPWVDLTGPTQDSKRETRNNSHLPEPVPSFSST